MPGPTTEGRFDDAVSIFFSDEGGVPEEELSRMKAAPLWKNMVTLAPQSVREWDELAEVGLTVDRYQNLSVPTLLLSGTQTANHPSFATQALESTLPAAQTIMLEGQGHLANLMAPDLVAQAVIEFLFTRQASTILCPIHSFGSGPAFSCNA